MFDAGPGTSNPRIPDSLKIVKRNYGDLFQGSRLPNGWPDYEMGNLGKEKDENTS
jgi:hypothetical protein